MKEFITIFFTIILTGLFCLITYVQYQQPTQGWGLLYVLFVPMMIGWAHVVHKHYYKDCE